MTSPIPAAELDGFLSLLATRRAPRTVEAYRRDLIQLAEWLDGPISVVTPAGSAVSSQSFRVTRR